MTISEAAREAILVQDACNLSGVLGSFNRIVHEVLWPEARRLGKGTEWVNHHPIVTLFLSKLDSLNGYGLHSAENGTFDYMHAADECEKLTGWKK